MGEAAPPVMAESAARAFAGGATPGPLEPLGGGLIHQTYAAPLHGAGPAELVVQRINTAIFEDPVALMVNLERITTHLRDSLRSEGVREIERRVLEVLRTDAGATLFEDPEGGVWRAFARIAAGVALGPQRGPAQLSSAASAFGDYARRLATLPGPPLHETLPGFHDFPRRRGAFDAALRDDRKARAGAATPVVEGLQRACEQLESKLPAATVAALPVRVAHHDCKLDNVLFDSRSGTALCVVDLDTSMPGRLLSDFGELVRSAAARGDEGGAEIDGAAFSALARGYLGALGTSVTPLERDALALAGAHMALMNALRFATDHLEGDVYFRLFAPGQNLLRARAQLALTEALLAAEDELRERLARASAEL